MGVDPDCYRDPDWHPLDGQPPTDRQKLLWKERDEHENRIFWWIVVAIFLGAFVLHQHGLLSPDDQPDNEPFVGLCNQPSTQGGC